MLETADKDAVIFYVGYAEGNICEKGVIFV